MQPIHVRRFRRALVGLILAILGAVALNYVSTWRRRARLIEHAAEILSPETVRSAEGIEYSENQKGVLRFRLRARRLVETKAGVSHLEGIEAFDSNPDGSRRNQIRSARAEYDRDHKRAFFSGDVRIAMSGGVELRTESLHYDLESGVGRSDARVEMTSPQARGSARGVRYQRAAESLEFAEELDFAMARTVARPDGSSATENVRARAARGFYSRSESLLRLEGGARLETDASLLESQVIEASFAGETNRLSALFCREHARYRATDAAETRSLEGDRLRFAISPETGALERIEIDGRGRFSAESRDALDDLRAGSIRVELDAQRGVPSRIESRSKVEFRRRAAASESLVTGERLDASFHSGTNQLDRLEVRERARLETVSSKPDAAAGSDELSAEEIHMTFRISAEGRSAPATLDGYRSVEWKSRPARREKGRAPEQVRTLRAATLSMTYAQSGEGLESGQASGQVVLAGIPVGDAERSEIRRLESDRAKFWFYPTGNRLREFDADGKVAVFFRKPPDPEAGRAAQEFRTSSGFLKATLRENDGGVRTFAQWGAFVYQEEGRTARAGRADYAAESEQLVLTEKPEATDSNATTTGERMEYDRRAQVMTVRRGVRSLLTGRSDDKKSLFTEARNETRPSAPSVVTADLMESWNAEGKVRYSGGVRLLTESGQLETRELAIFDSGDRVEATGDVRHLIVRAEAPAASRPAAAAAAHNPAEPRKPAPVNIKSSRMVYLNAESSAHYTGKTVLETRDVRIESESLDAVFAADGKQVERAAARGTVHVRQTDRDVHGEMADYYLAPGKFVVTGKPAQIIDPKKGKSSAARLTFFTSDEKILLETR